MPKKILLGGIPLGCDNIGDEAILGCVARMLRETLGDVELAVATADPGTATRLGVEVVPPFGFAGTPVEGFASAVRGKDAYIWCGATGLSDYPGVALDLLEAAQREDVDTYIWGVGMDDELNPAFFKAHGKRKKLLSLLHLAQWYESRLKLKLKRRIAKILPRCKGVWLRDGQSKAVLSDMGFDGARVAADTAILQTAEGLDAIAPARRLGLCISTQRQVADLDGLKGMLAAVRSSGAEVLGIPMNTKTDRALMESLGVHCIAGDTPEDVCKAAAGCAVVLSSRLHLLILAANVGTPVMGIARGSKLANWLANFDRTVEGSVSDCDWERTTRRVLAALADRGDWDEKRAKAYVKLRERLDKAREESAEAIGSQ